MEERGEQQQKRMEACRSLLAPKRKPPSLQAKAKGGWGFRGRRGENSIIWEGATLPGAGVAWWWGEREAGGEEQNVAGSPTYSPELEGPQRWTLSSC